jgi:hypothetical protein
VVCDLFDAVVGHVADPDSAPGGPFERDVVEADAARRHDPQRRQPLEVLLAHAHIRADEERDDIVAAPRLPAVDDLDSEPVEELAHPLQREAGSPTTTLTDAPTASARPGVRLRRP